MSGETGARWTRALALGASVVLAGAPHAARADHRQPQTTGPRECTPVHGTFTNVFLVGAQNCPTSPTNPPQCTLGRLSGDLTGTYQFTFLTITPLGDGNAPVEHFTGESHVTLENGDIFGRDFGSLRVTHFPLADFTTHLKITGGTGEFEGASGHLTIQGLASFITGQGSGTYNGVICTPKEPPVATR